ncbi:MAG: atoD, partial [Deltaproteobacteria bacterium]|nr:atoD [Deltaproteobacteria bacterium]
MFEAVAQGQGPLFMDPDADKAREFFQKKDRALKNKVMSEKDAVEKFVRDGDYLGIGGFGANRIPTAICHEIVRQRRKNLTFAGHTSTHDFQILAAGEVFNRCDIAYIIGLEARGLSPNARRYMESGKVESCEWTNYGMALRFKAAAMGVSFLPGRNMMGTDTFRYSAAKVVKCPFTGKLFCL